MEDVVDSRASLARHCDILDKSALDNIAVTLLILIDQIQYLRCNITAKLLVVHLYRQQLTLLRLQLNGYLLIQRWNALLNMANQDLVERRGEVWDAEALRVLRVTWMLPEKLGLVRQRLLDRRFVVNLLLRSALYAEVAKLERVDFTLEKIERIGALVHEVDLRNDADRSIAIWIDLSRNLQRV